MDLGTSWIYLLLRPRLTPIAGGAVIAKKFMSMEEWRRHPDNPRNTPKISPEANQRLLDDALAAGQKWDVQERINARRLADLNAECGGSDPETMNASDE